MDEDDAAMLADLDAAFDEPFDTVPFVNRVRWLFCCVDPTGGGRSCLAAVTVAFIENRMVVLDVANETARGHEAVKTVLSKHFDRVRTITGFKTTPIVVVVENNLGQEAEHIAHMFKQSDGSLLHFMREDGIAACYLGLGATIFKVATAQATRFGVFEGFEYKHTSALADYEAIPLGIKRAAGGRGVVIAKGQRLCAGKSRNA